MIVVGMIDELVIVVGMIDELMIVVVSRVADSTLGCIYYLQLMGEGLLVVVSHDYRSSL